MGLYLIRTRNSSQISRCIIIEVRELRPLLYYDENEEYQKEITCKIDLSGFTYEEQQDILKIKELEFDGDYYYPVYIGLGKNIKNRKEVA